MSASQALGTSSILVSRTMSNHESETEGNVEVHDLPEGTYRIRLGFPEITAKDTRYFYANREDSLQEKPVRLDVESESFQNLLTQFRKEAESAQNLEDVVQALSRVLVATIKRSSEDHDIERASEIVEKGEAACDGLVLVAGLLLKESGLLNPTDSVERIIGTSAPVGDTRSHDIGHAWLRISNGAQAVLYDPYFGVMRVYDLHAEEVVLDADDPFYSYEVLALGVANVNKALGEKGFSGPLRLVKSIRGENELFLVRPHALLAQIDGHIDYTFESAGRQLTTVGEALEVGKQDIVQPGEARLSVPVLGIETQ